EEYPARLTADVVLDIPQELTAEAPGLRLFRHGDPVQVPGAVRHGRRGVVGEAEDFAVLLVGHADVSLRAVVGVVVVEHLLDSLHLVRLEHAGPLGEGYQGRRVFGDGRTNHIHSLSGAEPLFTLSVHAGRRVRPGSTGSVPCRIRAGNSWSRAPPGSR